VDEHQVFQVAELTNGVVRGPSCLLPLFAADAYSNMSGSDHIDVVGSITDCQSCNVFILLGFADKFNHLSLLFGGDSACQDHVGVAS
jgi:hypothetical protein